MKNSTAFFILRRTLVFTPTLCAFSFLIPLHSLQAQETNDATPSMLTSAPIASFSGAATGENETPDRPAEKPFADSPSYKRYFANPSPVPKADPEDPRNGPTYKKFFVPISNDRSPRIKKKRTNGARSKPEHFGVSGHRRIHIDPEESQNAKTTIGRKTLENFVAGTNPLEALALSTPGASFASSDAQGLDAGASTFYLRGYDKSQLGFTMDGIPMGDQAFGGSSGVDVNQIEIQENIQTVTASQGAGALDTPSVQTLGGSVTYQTLDPSNKFGTKIGQLFGSFSGYRTFGRLDSGILNPTGTKFQASFLRNQSNNWTGGGFQREETENFKLVQPVSNFGKITLTSDWSDAPQYNYPENTEHMIKSLGYGDHNFYPNYGQAQTWAAACQSGNTQNLPPGVSAADACNLSYQGTQIERTYLEALRGDFQISPSIKSSSLVYGQVADNWEGGANPTLMTPPMNGNAGVDMAEYDEHIMGRRVGVTQNFQFQLGHRNLLRTGIWYENNRYHMPRVLHAFGPNDPINNDFGLTDSSGIETEHNQWTTNIFQFYIEDGFQMARNMTFTYGFKSLVDTTNGGMTAVNPSGADLGAWGLGPNSIRPAYGRLTAANAFLPHFNYDWKFLPKHELYFDVAENMRPYDAYAPWNSLGSAQAGFNSAQANFDEEQKNLRPERTWNYVVGYRYVGKPFGFSVDYYHTDYINRLGNIRSASDNIVGAGNEYLNLGNETMDGVDLAGTAHLSKMFHIPDYLGVLDFTNSFSYNHAVYDNGAVQSGKDFISIKGDQQIYYPRYMYKTNLHYTNGRLSWNFNVNYNSARSVTYTGDVKAPAYWSSELTGSYLLGPRNSKERIKLDFGITNLFGEEYIGGTYGPAALKATPNDDDTGTPNMFWAAPREFFGSVNVVF
ncbi:TonB-dependent receptor [Acetobacteraceae bacterium]|nr:TonB-dependent receptor [Acetobacteraceae bacterium]